MQRMRLLADMKLYQNTCPIISLIKTQFQSSEYIEQEEIALHGPQLTIASVAGASALRMKQKKKKSVTLSEINERRGGRCIIAGRMINWCLDDELWIHPGFLAGVCLVDGTCNEGNDEGRFRRMQNGRNNRNICASLQLEYNWDHISFSSLRASPSILAL